MSTVKVMVVDDSATVRRVISDVLDDVPGIQVIATAQDPLFAFVHMEKQWPDVIVSDVEMPRMDGLTFLRKIMSERPTPVVMCSTLTEQGSATSMKAIGYGAVGIIAKPKATNLKSGLKESAGELIDAVKAASKANLKVLKSTFRPRVTPYIPAPKLTSDVMLNKPGPAVATNGKRVVAIGTSTGGTQALELVLTGLKRTTPPIVVVQHMPEKFTQAFAERLDNLCAVEVKEASDGDAVLPGRVLIAPGGQHMMLESKLGQHYVVVKSGPLVSRHRPSVDVLFRSVAKVAGPNALGIIMTGMGDDGAAGLKEMHDTGARTLAQNEATCVIYGMPAVAVKRGAVDQEIALEDISDQIMSY